MLHARADYNRIQDPQNLIPQDEPVFLIRANDKVAPDAVEAWISLAYRAGAKPDILEAAQIQANRMKQWQRQHSSKIPDMPEPSCCTNSKQGTTSTEVKATGTNLLQQKLNALRLEVDGSIVDDLQETLNEIIRDSNDKDTNAKFNRTLLTDAALEITQLRQQLALRNTRLQMFDDVMLLLRSRIDYGGAMCAGTEDIVSKIQNAVAR